MTTWIDVADTAIKIGFGAVIAGAFSIYRDKHLSKKERSKFILGEEYRIFKETVKLISEYQNRFRIDAINQEKNYQLKFSSLLPETSKLSLAITNLIYLGLKDSSAVLKTYNNAVESYIGCVQQHIMDTGGDGHQNRLEPNYGMLVRQYENLIEKISCDFKIKHMK